jgi:hypothetical protein
LIEHDLFGKPASTFPDHALGNLRRRSVRRLVIKAQEARASANVIELTDIAWIHIEFCEP